MTKPKIQPGAAAKVQSSSADAPALIPPATFPSVGMSRWTDLSPFVAVSREKWRQLVMSGKAPAPHRLSERCTMYPNIEVHRWLADPVNYRQTPGGAA
jgi:prophage regulatory protein